MPWPTPQEYNEAIQNPALTIADSELAAGTVETTALGLPRPITGNFASVYRLRCTGRDWAVRCFWREYVDMQERYAAISAHLHRHPLPYTVGFEYLPRGIRVHGVWYPILKMEWVEGELLGAYIERHLNDPAALTRLAGRWKEMGLALEAAGMAHGDLQHGNILVVNGALRLVDYDAVYVPALRGRGSHELGHQHYQHPGRSERDFGPGLDRFSALVVECSLRALAGRPELWSTLQAGDESLLFRRSDFADPAASPAFRLLLTSSDPEVSGLARVLRTALDGRPMDLPAPAVASPFPSARRGPLSIATMLTAAFPTAPASPPPAANAVPGWLADHLPRRSQPRPGAVVRAVLLVGWSLAVLWLAAGVLLGVAPAIVAAGVAVGMVGAALVPLAAFHREDEVRALKRKLREERRHRRALAALERESSRYQKRRAGLEARYALREAGDRKRLRRLRDAEQRDLDLAAALLTERTEAAEALRAALSEAEREEVEAALSALQHRHVRARLRGHSVRSAPLPAIVRVRLFLLGVHTAASVDAERMESIRRLGGDVAEVVAEWRVDAELDARRSAPSVLEATTLHRLTARFSRARARIDLELDQARERDERLREVVAAYWSARRLPVEDRLRRHGEALQRALRELDQAVEEVSARAQPVRIQLARTHRELEPYGELSFGRYLVGALRGSHSAGA